MNLFSVDSYDESSRKSLRLVVEEIRDQFLASGGFSQFWFYPAQMTNKTLSEPVLYKWLKVLSDSGLLYFYRPSSTFEYEQILALTYNRLGDNHKWDQGMFVPFVTGVPSGMFPGYAIDIYDTDLDSLVKLLSMNKSWGSFSQDSMTRLYYNDVPLTRINNSVLQKEILLEFLTAKNNEVKTSVIMDALARHREANIGRALSEEEKREFLEDPLSHENRNRYISKIRKELRRIDHRVDIVPSKREHHAVSCYKLIFF